MKKIAIFDIDGTIFRSSLLIELVDVLIEREIFPKEARAEYEAEEVRWLDRKGDYEAYIMAVVHVFVKHIKGVHYDDFLSAAKTVVERYRHRTYVFTETLIRDLKKDGYYLLAISQSPKVILDLFCNELGFDKAYGRIYETDENMRFTGKIVDEEVISVKANIVRHVASKEGFTLEHSVGVGDTEGDISLLEHVTRPICFNPNAKLYRHALEHGWQVFVERKDVVYEMSEVKETGK